MKRIAHFAIPAVILLFTVTVCAKLVFTPIQTGVDRYAWKFRPYRAATYWERGWPWVFATYNVEDPETIGGVLGPANAYRRGYNQRALIYDLSVGLAVVFIVSVWLFLRMRRTRPWCFSVRGILVGTGLIAACCGWWFHERRLWQREQAAIAELSAVQCFLESESQSPAWLKRLFAGHVVLPRNAGGYYQPSIWNWPERELVIFLRVRSAHFATMPEPRESFQRMTNWLPNFRSLREVSFAASQAKPSSHLDAELLAPLVKCSSVIDLRPWYSDIDDAGIAAIAEMPSLQELNLNSCPNVTDGAIDSLLKRHTLEILWLKGTSISNAGLKHLLELPNLKIVSTDAHSPETLELFRNRGILEDRPGFSTVQ